MKGYFCPSCRERSLVQRDDHELKCEGCGNVITKATYINQTAEKIRRSGHDRLADRLEAAAEGFRGREME